MGTLPIKRVGLTPFSFSRFLCPYLCDYQGYSLFLDVDMLVLGDICELMAMAKPEYVVSVVKGKMSYEWPSLMLFNNELCKILTPEFVDQVLNPYELWWAEKVGELPLEWNHCIGYDRPREDAKLVHFTQGIPFFPETEHFEYTAEWRAELEAAISSEPWKTLMGESVHALSEGIAT